MPEFVVETLIDTLKSLPILFLVYLLIEWLENHVRAEKLVRYRNSVWSPLTGALAGCIPQCGFSAAFATLYRSGVIGAGTLIAVFLSTSDEALPIMISRSADLSLILQLLIWKIIIASVAGYVLTYTVFRKEKSGKIDDPLNLIGCDDHCHEHHRSSMLVSAIKHTVKTSLFICVTLLVINSIVFLVGEDLLQDLLLTESIFQPMLTAVLGLIPGCATSVLLVELFLQGSVSFASAVAGLSSSAGFGFLILFKGNKGKKEWKDSFKILLLTYLSAVIAGMILQVIL